MASSITLAGDWLGTTGAKRTTYGTGNLGTYSSGGITITAQQLGLGHIESLQVEPAGGYVFNWNGVLTILAYEAGADGGALDEVGTTDISAAIFRWRAIGY